MNQHTLPVEVSEYDILEFERWLSLAAIEYTFEHPTTVCTYIFENENENDIVQAKKLLIKYC